LIHPKKKAEKHGYKNSGVLSVVSCEVQCEWEFIDYVKGNYQIGITIGIDFTGSNGNPTFASSLHYAGNPAQPNPYQKAISAVGTIIQDYDSDKLFPLYGFGGDVPGKGTSHCFALNGNEASPSCTGVAGVLQTYTAALQKFSLSAPTNFAPIINATAKLAEAAKDSKKYIVLLMITDGGICDQSETVKAIIDASPLPMSIIIIGVGKDAFAEMKVLDSDGKGLEQNGKKEARDIVQFVTLRDFEGKDPALLTKEVLAELPGQVMEYVKLHNITP